MSAVPNHALRQLRAGKLAIGVGLRQARTVDDGAHLDGGHDEGRERDDAEKRHLRRRHAGPSVSRARW